MFAHALSECIFGQRRDDDACSAKPFQFKPGDSSRYYYFGAASAVRAVHFCPHMP